MSFESWFIRHVPPQNPNPRRQIHFFIECKDREKCLGFGYGILPPPIAIYRNCRIISHVDGQGNLLQKKKNILDGFVAFGLGEGDELDEVFDVTTLLLVVSLEDVDVLFFVEVAVDVFSARITGNARRGRPSLPKATEVDANKHDSSQIVYFIQ